MPAIDSPRLLLRAAGGFVPEWYRSLGCDESLADEHGWRACPLQSVLVRGSRIDGVVAGAGRVFAVGTLVATNTAWDMKSFTLHDKWSEAWPFKDSRGAVVFAIHAGGTRHPPVPPPPNERMRAPHQPPELGWACPSPTLTHVLLASTVTGFWHTWMVLVHSLAL